MPEVLIRGVPVNFPFEPYQVQRDYMEKVIECLQSGTHGVLESPTGTGKTLSLLCSSLAWLMTKKAQVQAAKMQQPGKPGDVAEPSNNLNTMQSELLDQLNEVGGAGAGSWGIPKIIYASRTHSQLTQAMGEMKRTSYAFMKAAIIGSRDQLCIHPEVSQETGNSNKIYMCRAKIQTRTCSFYTRVEAKKDHPDVKEAGIMDIEDLVKVGQKHKCCPYFLSKELVERADIIFMPYNYLLDPKARKANNLELNNAVVILDEAHNVEKMCEDAASVQLKSSDLAVCIEEITGIMKQMAENQKMGFTDEETEANFSLDDLATLKELLLGLERAIDQIQINFSEGTTFPGNYIFEIMTNAGITNENSPIILKLLDDLIQFITTMSEKSGFSSRGGGLSLISDMLTIIFAGKDSNFRERVRRCYKVHVTAEEQKPQKNYHRQSGGWNTKTTAVVNSKAKTVSYWCFNPGFGMTQVMSQNVHSIILTSGTLAPLKPLISELGIPVHVRLENPHIIGESQVYVKIIGNGPDREPLLSNYENRNNPKYVQSLGRTILSVSPIIPDGLLIFFPSYAILTKCQEAWQSSGIWNQIQRVKPIFIEPRTKDEFNIVMTEYYAKINDPHSKGAIFMAVCRGKVSEGLDFADMNGRGVIITGLPFPPVKDARVILKRKYLEENRSQDKSILTGQEWYGLEATRAVNQAIGRVIRHKNDYGVILLCDTRFNDRRQRDQLSRWIQGHLKDSDTNFGKIIGELSRFFKTAERTLPCASLKPIAYSNSPSKARELMSGCSPVKPAIKIKTEATLNAIKIENSNSVQSWTAEDYQNRCSTVKLENDFKPKNLHAGLHYSNNTSLDFYDQTNFQSSTSGQVTIHKRPNTSSTAASSVPSKKAKINFSTLLSDMSRTLEDSPEESDVSFAERVEAVPQERVAFLQKLKMLIRLDHYRQVLAALGTYRDNANIEKLTTALLAAFQNPSAFHMLVAMRRFIKDGHKERFDARVKTFLEPYGIEV